MCVSQRGRPIVSVDNRNVHCAKIKPKDFSEKFSETRT
jgi:hypothetical protein